MSRAGVASLALLALPVAVTLPAGAQSTTFTIDAGSARTRYADSITVSTLSISPSLRLTGRRAALSASGTFSHLGTGWSNGALVDVSAFGPRRRRFSTELAGIAGGSTHSDGAITGQLLSSLRLHARAPRFGVWLGGGVGSTWDGSWRTVAQGDLGAWLTRDQGGIAAVTVSPTSVDDTIRYVDTFLSLRHPAGVWELQGSLGFRGGDKLPSLPANRSSWGSISATRWLSPSAGIVASAGAYPVDLTQGFPGGQFIALSVRFAPGRTRFSLVAPEAVAQPTAEITHFKVEQASQGTRLRVRAPTASSVEIAGDFTLWSAVAMQSRPDGWWTATLPIASGTHEVNVRINGGAWRVPPGLTPLTDEFGGSVGLLLVPW